jgi:hypothetical protein
MRLIVRTERGRLDPPGLQGLTDGGGAVEAQVAGRLQVAAHLQDQILDRGLGPLDRPGEARPIGPIDAVQALAVGVVDPMVDRRGAHVKLSGDIVVRAAVADGLDHGTATGGVSVSLLMVRPFPEVAFPTSLRRKRSGCGGTWLFGM